MSLFQHASECLQFQSWQQRLLLILVLTCGGLWWSQRCRSRVNDAFSRLVHTYLCWRYPIKSVAGRETVPTCPYRWPNGHGDVAKFIQGVENSVQWGQDYGGIYRIWAGMTSEVVLTTPEQVRMVFRDSDKHIKALNNDAGWLMGELLGRCVGLISQQDWKRVRGTIEHTFEHSTTRGYLDAIESRTTQYFSSLNIEGLSREGLLKPVDDLKMLPFWIVADVLYGRLTSDMEAQLQAMIPLREGLFRHIVLGGLPRFSWSRCLDTKVNRDLADFKTKWTKFNEAAYERAVRQRMEASILPWYQAMCDGRISNAELSQTLDEMLFANLDVTIGGISWNMLFLGANKPVQEELREEIAIARRNAKDFASDWDVYMQSSSTLLARCILESSRLRPLAAFSVPQSAPSCRVLSGYLFPAGTNYVVDTYALNVRNPFWGNDGATYKPSRWLNVTRTQARYHFWRFGFGPRTCLGRYLADMIIRAVVVYLVENYELGLVGGEGDWDRKPDAWITHPASAVVCRKLEESIVSQT